MRAHNSVFWKRGTAVLLTVMLAVGLTHYVEERDRQDAVQSRLRMLLSWTLEDLEGIFRDDEDPSAGTLARLALDQAQMEAALDQFAGRGPVRGASITASVLLGLGPGDRFSGGGPLSEESRTFLRLLYEANAGLLYQLSDKTLTQNRRLSESGREAALEEYDQNMRILY